MAYSIRIAAEFTSTKWTLSHLQLFMCRLSCLFVGDSVRYVTGKMRKSLSCSVSYLHREYSLKLLNPIDVPVDAFYSDLLLRTKYHIAFE